MNFNYLQFLKLYTKLSEFELISSSENFKYAPKVKTDFRRIWFILVSRIYRNYSSIHRLKPHLVDWTRIVQCDIIHLFFTVLFEIPINFISTLHALNFIYFSYLYVRSPVRLQYLITWLAAKYPRADVGTII